MLHHFTHNLSTLQVVGFTSQLIFENMVLANLVRMYETLDATAKQNLHKPKYFYAKKCFMHVFHQVSESTEFFLSLYL